MSADLIQIIYRVIWFQVFQANVWVGLFISISIPPGLFNAKID